MIHRHPTSLHLRVRPSMLGMPGSGPVRHRLSRARFFARFLASNGNGQYFAGRDVRAAAEQFFSIEARQLGPIAAASRFGRRTGAI